MPIGQAGLGIGGRCSSNAIVTAFSLESRQTPADLLPILCGCGDFQYLLKVRKARQTKRGGILLSNYLKVAFVA